MTSPDQTTDICNAFMRVEISAIETFTQAIDKFSGVSTNDSLERIRVAHADYASLLRLLIAEGGTEPATEYGILGGYAQALEGATTLFGESPDLRILPQGETPGFTENKEPFANPGKSDKAGELILRDLPPPLSDHLIGLRSRRDRAA